MEDGRGYEDKQAKSFDGIGIMLINMVCMPPLAQFVEPMVFGVPARGLKFRSA
jgi:hypothetical protein